MDDKEREEDLNPVVQKLRADLAERFKILKACQDPVRRAEFMELCRRDPVVWFDYFAYTVDPRKAGLDGSNGTIPFKLYPYQRWAIREWYSCIERQEDFGVDKSRDMGASWMLTGLFTYCWIFRPGWDFHIGSRRENEVDTVIADPSTLFGKVRILIANLPKWMRPAHTDKKLTLRNEENGNMITGESANISFGRGPRKRAILLDEFAFWDAADAVYGGCSATTNCRIVTSTPYGEWNRFSKLMNNPDYELREPPEDDQIPSTLDKAS